MDSDDDDGKSPSNDMSQATLCKRNKRYMLTHGCKVALSSDTSGNGLFATSDVKLGTELPVKGPWFHTEEQVNEWLSSLHPDSAEMLATRVIRVNLAPSQEQSEQAQDKRVDAHLFKVMTSPIGFINHFSKIASQANCKLVWKNGVPRSEYNLVVTSSRPIKAGAQLLLNYGPLHPVVEKTLKRKRV